jgi:flagellar motility protein MotE (MotC chaperone)
VKDYCSSFVDTASERRLTRLNDALTKTRAEVDARIEELKAQAAELKSLIDARKAMQAKVGESLLKIYVQVEPDAAAQQLSKLEPGTAAEILVKMNPKRSGEILSLMDPKKAAALVALLTLQTSPEKVPKS